MMLGAADFVAGRPGWSVRLAAAADLAASTGRPPLELELRSWLAWSLASNGQAADAETQLLRCAELGAAESIHGQQCAVAAQLVSIWRGRPLDEGVFGSIRLSVDDRFIGFAAAFRCLYTGDASELDVAWDDDADGVRASMRRVIIALRALVIGDDLPQAAREAEAEAEVPWLGRPVFPVVWLAATMQLAAGRVDAARRLTEVAASVAAPDGWGEVGVAMLRSELALHDGEFGAAERTALNALTVAVRQDLRPWLCDVIEQIAFVDAAAGRLDRAAALGHAVEAERRATGYSYRVPHRQVNWQALLAPLADDERWTGATADVDTEAEWLLRPRGWR
jgi:hypothetical protein